MKLNFKLPLKSLKFSLWEETKTLDSFRKIENEISLIGGAGVVVVVVCVVCCVWGGWVGGWV